MNKEEFKEKLCELGINITDNQMNLLDKYYKMIIEYNKHTNLTRITDEKEVYLKHYYDSASLIKAVNLSNQSLLDVGTGAGFPGIVLKIIFPQLNVVLLDSLNKRVMFLNEVIKSLNLEKICAIHKRAEEYALENRERFDIVTSRAVANLRVLSELCIPMVKIGGVFVPMKSDVSDELKEAESIIKKLGSTVEEVISFDLYNNDLKRSLVIIRKNTKTSMEYPRKFSDIKKKAL